MRKPTKAALLSVFVFPGVGHIFLKQYFSGAVLASAALLALHVLISSALEKALDIVDKIQQGEVPPDIAIITELVSGQPMAAEAQLITMATVALIVVWLVSWILTAWVGCRSVSRAAEWLFIPG